MGLLDFKSRIFDIILTDRGRELLSQNNLEFAYYAFSDEGMDYSGSLSASGFSGSIDPYVFRNFSFEAYQASNQEFSSYLYTIPAKSNKIPEMTTTVNSSSLNVLNRYYYQTNVSFSNEDVNYLFKPLDIIVNRRYRDYR